MSRRSLHRLTTCAIVDEGFFSHEKGLRAAMVYGGDHDQAVVNVQHYHTFHLAKSRKRDGFVARETALEWRLGAASAARASAALVAAGLWDVVEGGYRFHDYYRFYSPQRAASERREHERARVAEFRAKEAARQARDAAYSRAYRARQKAGNVRSDDLSDDRRSSDLTRKPATAKQGRIHKPKPTPRGKHAVRRTDDSCTPYPPPEKRLTHDPSVRPKTSDDPSDGDSGDTEISPSTLEKSTTNVTVGLYGVRTPVQKNGAEILYAPPPPDPDPYEEIGSSPPIPQSKRTAQPGTSYTQVARGHEPRAQSGALMRTNGRTNGREQPLRAYMPADDKALARFLIQKFKADWRAKSVDPLADLGEFAEEIKRSSAVWCQEKGIEGSRSNRAANDALDTIRAAINNEQRARLAH